MATFNTRIQLKCDTHENWLANDIVLMQGEIGLEVIADSTGISQVEPTVMMKVGDGTKKFSELDYVSAKASDVYAWAKTAAKPTYQASEITGLEDFISGQIKDTNTQYQIVKNGNMGFKLQKKDVGDAEFTDVNDITLTAPAITTGTTNGTIKVGEQEVAVAGLQDAAYTTIANIIAQVAPSDGSAEATDNTVAGAKKYADEKIAALDYSDSAVEGQFVTQVTEADGVIAVTRAAINTDAVQGLNAALAAKQDTVVFNTAYDASSNKAATMTDVTNAVAGLTGAMHYVGTSTTDPATGTVTIGDAPYTGKVGDVVVYNAKEYVCESVGEGTATWRLLGDEGSYAVKGAITDADIAASANIATSKIAGLDAALGRLTAVETAVGEGGSVSTQIDNKIAALDYTDAAVASQFVTQVTETDGVIAVTRAQAAVADINGLTEALAAKTNDSDLAPVAKSGKIDDLTQDAVLILNCGSATVNV